MPPLSSCLLTVIALLGLAPQATRSPVRYDPWLTAFDALTRPGSTVPMRAKLEHAGPWGIHLHMRGYAIRFASPGLINQESKTEEESTATVQVKPPPGALPLYRISVTFAGSAHHEAARAASRLFVWPKNSLILITDVDHTISDLSELKVPFTADDRIPPLPGAVEALRELAVSYRIIYLSARDEILYEKTRAWLNTKGFPEGPVFCRDFHLGDKQEAFKQRFISELKKHYPNVSVGVGDQPSDAKAYLNNGLKAFLIKPKESGAAPKGAVIVRSWQEVCRQLHGSKNRSR
jgi:hypothetical protein